MLGLKAGGSYPTFLLNELLNQCIRVFIVFYVSMGKKKSGQIELQKNRPKKSILP